jgi:hypothetical protein
MVMSSFVVNPKTLRALQNSVLGLAAELYNGANLSDHYGWTREDSSGQPIQDGSLNEADELLSDFFAAWQGSLAEIGANMEDVAKKLGAAADGYVATDNNCMPSGPTYA